MNKIIFGLLSLFLTIIDVRIGLYVIKDIYGEKVFSLLISTPFLLLFYILSVFFVEYLVVSTLGTKILNFLRHL
jgi:Zn-dependent protease with chaperone function